MTRTQWLPPLVAGILIIAASFSHGLTTVSKGGAWPEDWLPEFESVRERATTMDNGAEKTHYVPLRSTEEFEGLWYAVLNLKSPGGTLTLRQVGSDPGIPDVDGNQPAVVLHMPSGAFLMEPDPERADAAGEADSSLAHMEDLVEQGKALRADAPWPRSAYLANGELSEYVKSEVRDGKRTWVPTTEPGRNQRARVDIELIVDGDVIDLNRTHLPPDTRIIDDRGL